MSLFRWKTAQWFELRWWRNYLRGKDRAQYLSWKTNYWHEVLNQLPFKVDASCSIADLGCGPAGIFIALPNAVTAVDPLMSAYLQNGFLKPELYPQTKFLNSRLEDFSSRQKFDVVFCMNCINHVTDIEAAYDVLKDCLTEKGKLVMTVDAHNYNFFKHLFRLIPGDVLHPHQYDLTEYCLFLKERGLNIALADRIKKEFFFDHYLIVAENG